MKLKLLSFICLFTMQAFSQEVLITMGHWPNGVPQRIKFVTGNWLLAQHPDWALVNFQGVFREGKTSTGKRWGWIQVGTTDCGYGKLPRTGPNDFIALTLAVRESLLFASTPTEVKYIRIDSLNFSRWQKYDGELPESLIKVYDYSLLQNYPNPFYPTTQIKYSLKEDGYVRIVLFNSVGQYIETLVDDFRETGDYIFVLDLSNHASGLYIYNMQVNGYKNTKKLLLLK